MVRNLVSAAIAVAMMASSTVAIAADKDTMPQHQQASLQPGKPAGVHNARWVMVNGHWIWFVGAAVIIGGVALAASGGHSSTTTTTTTHIK